MLVSYCCVEGCVATVPFPLTVMGVREVEDARGARTWTGEGVARTEVAADNAAMTLKVFMIVVSWNW